tara:strand:- start:1219 stop:2496 length:1278 start_codon:yes stop_codon:yes gene_type:complete
MKETDRLLPRADDGEKGAPSKIMCGKSPKSLAMVGVTSFMFVASAGYAGKNYAHRSSWKSTRLSDANDNNANRLFSSSSSIKSAAAAAAREDSNAFSVLSQLGVQPISKLKSGHFGEPQTISKSEFSSYDDERYPKHYIPRSNLTPELGNWGTSTNSDEYKRDIKASFDPESLGLPRHFDARKEWKECKGLIGTVRDQGKCGSCWAVAATEIINDRSCIAHGKMEELSPQYALSCYSAGEGCNGGNVVDTLQEAMEKGLPTGGMLGDSSSACLPYEFEACDHPCQVPGTVAEQCPTTCADGTPITDTEIVRPKSKPYECPAGDWKCIAQELYKYGPMAVTFGPVCDDFYGHKHGVYEQPKDGKPLGLHATKIIGWGFEGDDEETGKGGKPYWIMINSWQNWGDHGVGRIGVGEMSIEGEATAVKM